MKPEMNETERKILETLEAILRQEPVAAAIDSIVLRVERKLTQDLDAALAWEPVPLSTYGKMLPPVIRSSWVFVCRAQSNTGAERHPNSHQRMMSYRGSGDLQIWDDDQWCSNPLVSDSDVPIEKRWVSILPNTWHQAVVPQENWVVVSFHTASEDKFIEERPGPNDTKLAYQRKYSDQ